MLIKTLRAIRLPTGKVPIGSVIDLPTIAARFHLSRGEAELHTPFDPAGQAQSSSASPADQASTQPTSNESGAGDRRRSRRKPEPSA